MKLVSRHSGEEACESNFCELQPDILITDIRMCQAGSLEAGKKLKELDSALEVIIISGYAHFDMHGEL